MTDQSENQSENKSPMDQDPPITVSRQIISNTLSAWAGTVVNGLVGFLMVPLMLERLGKQGYGLVALLGSIVGLGALVDLGLRGALSRYLSEHVAQSDQKSFNQLISSAMAVYLLIGGLCSVACIAFAGPIAHFFHVAPGSIVRAGGLIRWYASSMMLLGFVSPVFSGIVISLGRYDVLNMIQLGASVARGIGFFVVVGAMHKTLYGWALVSFGAALLGMIATAVMARRMMPGVRLSLRDVRKEALRPLFALGSQMFTLQITTVMNTQSDPIVIGSFLGPAGVALYNPGLSLVSLFRPIITALSDQLSPFATYFHVKGQPSQLQALLIRGTRYTFLMGILTFALLGVFSDQIMSLWLNRSIGSEHVVVARVLFGWALIDLGTYAAGTQWAVMLAANSLKRLVHLEVLLGILNIAASIYLVGYTRLGVTGVLIPTIVQRVFVLAMLSPYAARLCGLSWMAYFRAAYLRPLCAGALLMAVAISLRELWNPRTLIELIACFLLVTAVWGLLSWTIALQQRDRQAFAKILKSAGIDVNRIKSRLAISWSRRMGGPRGSAVGRPQEGKASSDYPDGIFIVGCHRSGTTLMRFLMDSHPLVACPPESKFIGGLRSFLTYPQAVDGMRSLGLTDQNIRRLVLGVVQDTMMHYAALQGKPRWIDKTPNYSLILPFIDDLFEKRAKYIIILRHPFDSAISLQESFKRTTADGADPDLASVVQRHGNDRYAWMHYWREVNEKLLSFSRAHADRCYLLKYEDLVSSPEDQVSEILDFLEIERVNGDAARMCTKAFRIPHGDGYQDGKILGTHEVHDRSVNRWVAWRPEDIASGWAIVGDVALALGYECNLVTKATGLASAER